MANSTKNIKPFESVAATAMGNAFAVVQQDGQADAIEIWQVADDLADWSWSGVSTARCLKMVCQRFIESCRHYEPTLDHQDKVVTQSCNILTRACWAPTRDCAAINE